MRFENILSLLMVMLVLFVSISAISAQDTNDTLAIDNVLDDELSEGDLSYYVSNDGSDDNDGSLNSPYKTIGTTIIIATIALITLCFISSLPFITILP